jgi:hypothetical protein
MLRNAARVGKAAGREDEFTEHVATLRDHHGGVPRSSLSSTKRGSPEVAPGLAGDLFQIQPLRRHRNTPCSGASAMD